MELKCKNRGEGAIESLWDLQNRAKMAKIAKMDKAGGKCKFFFNHGRTRKVDTSIFHEARLKFSTSGYEWKQSKM